MLATRFIVMREIGSGGSGVVYEVIDRHDGAMRALKVLRATSAEALYRFKREFRALRDVVHPNLVALHDLAVEGGQWYFTMDLVPGCDFLEHVWNTQAGRAIGEAATVELDPRASRFDLDRLRSCLRQLVLGITALHDAGKIHRDLKPSNVRVQPDGRVVVLDFGLVVDQDDPGRSYANMIVGTPAYMAPEQVGCGVVGPATDWYALGIMLYEALTGRLPFSGSLFQVLEDRQQIEPAPPSSVAPGVPSDLDRLCADLLRIDPDARPSGAEILARLDAVAPHRRTARGTAVPQGRELELGALSNAVVQGRRGQAAAVCLVGPTGSGKTGLLAHVAAALARDPRNAVLTARCHARERVPFQGFDGVIDGLSRLLSQLPMHEQLDVVPVHLGVLAATFPVLGRVPVLAEITQSDDDDPREIRDKIATALRDLLTRLAQYRNVVIIIDDLDCADPEGLALLGALVRGPAAPPVAFLLAARDGNLIGLPSKVERIALGHDTVDDTYQDLQLGAP